MGERLQSRAVVLKSTCRMDHGGCGVLVRVKNGVAIKIEGNHAKARMSNRPVVVESHVTSGRLDNFSITKSNLSWATSKAITAAKGKPILPGSATATMHSTPL